MFFHSYVSLPEGTQWQYVLKAVLLRTCGPAVLQCPASKVTNEELSMAKASAGMMSAAGDPNILWRTEHPRSWKNSYAIFSSEYFKLCMRGVSQKSAKLLESLTFNGQKMWLLLLILHFYGHYCHESSISMGQKLWWFHPSFHPSISRRDSKRWLPSWHCIAAWVCQWGDFFHPVAIGKTGKWWWHFYPLNVGVPCFQMFKERLVSPDSSLTIFLLTHLGTWGGHSDGFSKLRLLRHWGMSQLNMHSQKAGIIRDGYILLVDSGVTSCYPQKKVTN